jgi:deaminated glutathione amidase
MGKLRVAAIQMQSGRDPVRNSADMIALVREAASSGAAFVQTPEMTGFLTRGRAEMMRNVRKQGNDKIVAAASKLAGELGIYLHIGSTAILRDDGKIANRAFLFGPDGGLITTYDKIHMFDVDLDKGESWRESATYEPGTRAVVADLPFGKLGFAVCYDVRFPQLFREEALAGAQILTAPAAFTKQTGEAHWHILQRSRAIENGAFMVSAAQAGLHEDGRETYGHSMIVDPWGRIVAEAGGDGPEIIHAQIDLSEVAEARKKIPNLKNARAFSVDHVTLAAVEGRQVA